MPDNGRGGYRPVKRPPENDASRRPSVNDTRDFSHRGRSSEMGNHSRNQNFNENISRSGSALKSAVRPAASGRSAAKTSGEVQPKVSSSGARVRVNTASENTSAASSGRRRASESGVQQRDKSLAYERAPHNLEKKGGFLSVFKRKSPEMIRMEEEAWNAGIIRTRGGIDRVFLALVIALLCMGTIMVFSASYPYAIAKTGDGLFYIRKQIVFVILGVIAMVVVSFVPYRVYKDLSWVIYGVCCLLLVAVLLVGLSEGGAKRWLGVPGTALSLQPSELMKAALPIMLAWYYDKYRDKVRSRSSLGGSFVYSIGIPLLFIVLACGLVLMEKHLSGTLIIAAIGFCVMFLGGAHLGILAGCGVGFLGAAVIYVMNNSYALQRILTLQGDTADNLKDRWQVSQGLNAIGNGGLFGIGLSQSTQKNSYVSQAQNDFIFTIWCEEMGFVGAVFVILVFVALIWRGYSIARKAPDTFSSLVVFGIVSQVGIQAFLNMCVVTELIPNTGISLPFFSYGGTSLVVLLAEMGIILSVSRQSYLKK